MIVRLHYFVTGRSSIPVRESNEGDDAQDRTASPVQKVRHNSGDDDHPVEPSTTSGRREPHHAVPERT
jgi:hypothetical protein